jgi:hypothetical protein
MIKRYLNSDLLDPKPSQGLGCRVVGKVKYYGGPWFGTKAEAKDYSEKIRKKGMRAIIVSAVYRSKKGYRVYDAGWRK